MDADQRLVALKRAYADIILNTSKEAEARVMVSERKSQQLEHQLRVTKEEAIQMMLRLKKMMDDKKKSQQLEHQLRVTKEEAIQMMLRLKKMMDDKIRKAKITSQNQQEKIDELEAQLQEAEDIVSELRKEQRYVQAKYERVTRNDLQHLDKHETATSEVAFEENRQYISQSILCPPQLQKFSLIASDKENSYLHQRTEYPKRPSQVIQMKNSNGTNPELPSIILRSKKHMFYRNGFTQRIHACERNVLDGGLSLSRQPNSVSRGKEGEQTDIRTCNATIDGVNKMFNMGRKEAMHKDDSVSFWYDVQAMNLIPEKGKTTPKYRKNKSTTPSDPNRKLFRNNTEPNRDPTLIASKLSSNIAGLPTQPEFAKTTKMNEDNDRGDIGKMIRKGEARVDMSVPIVQKEGASTKNLDVQVSKLNLKKINEPVQYCELKPTDATSEGPSLPVAKGVIKYTFQRRRKRGTVSIAESNVSAKNNTSVRKKARQNDSAETEKSSLVSESSLSLYLYGR